MENKTGLMFEQEEEYNRKKVILEIEKLYLFFPE